MKELKIIADKKTTHVFVDDKEIQGIEKINFFHEGGEDAELELELKINLRTGSAILDELKTEHRYPLTGKAGEEQ